MTVTPAGGRILVVGDSEASRNANSRWLRQAGFEVFESATGAAALAFVSAHAPDLVVLGTPLDTDGRDLCRRIKSRGADAPLVLQVSPADVQEGDAATVREGGADACLVEPLDPAVMLATVRALVRMRHAEQALRQALTRERALRHAAEGANLAKDEFLATLAHELRSPLGTILAWVTLLKEGRLSDERRGHGLNAIERSTQLQARLIGDLLDMSSLLSGKTRLELASVDLGTVVQAAVEGIRSGAAAKSIAVTHRVDAGVPRIAGDARRLLQVMQHLCSNAVECTPAGGAVQVEVRSVEDMVEIEVRDDGRGIAPELLPHVFERLRHADSASSRSEGGLGVGLAIVRRLVELHQGSVEARSAGAGQGATFLVRLPVARLAAEPPSPPAGG